MKQVFLLATVFLLVVLATSFFLYSKNRQISQPSPTDVSQVVGGDRDEHGCILSAGYSWCEVKQKCLRPWEEECSSETSTSAEDENASIIADIRPALIDKHGPQAAQMILKVNKVEGVYASGSATEEGGGGMWFAAQVGGAWKLIWDGNGSVMCDDIVSYPGFPKSMIPECWDETTQKLIIR